MTLQYHALINNIITEKSHFLTVALRIKIKNIFILDIPSVKLDGDQIRRGLNSDICSPNVPTLSVDDDENLRRSIELCLLIGRSDCVTICSFVSPYKKWRQTVRRKHHDAEIPYFEVKQDLFSNVFTLLLIFV